jgi:hypothetical protein
MISPKKQIAVLTALFLFAVLVLPAQHPHQAGYPDVAELGYKPGNATVSGCMLYDSAGQWLSTGYFKDATPFTTPAYILKTDSTGHIIWSATPVQAAFRYSEYSEIRDMVRTLDGNIVIAGLYHVCDLPQGAGFIQKLSQTGATVWSKAYYAAANVIDIPFTHLKELRSGRLCLTTDSAVYFTKSNGDSIWAHTYHMGEIYGVEENNLHQIVLSCKRGILKMDTVGTVINTYAFPKPVQTISQDVDSTYVIVSGGFAEKLDTGFNVTGSLDLTPFYASVSKLKIRNAQYWLVGKDTVAGAARVMSLSPQLAVRHTSTFCDAKVTGRDIDAGLFQVGISGTEYTKSSSNAFVKTFNDTLYGGKDSTDAGVIRVTVDSSYSLHPAINPPSYYDIHFRAHVTVKNFGNDSLHTVFLNTYLGHGGPCGPQTFDSMFAVKLGPGDTVQIQPRWMVASGVHYSSSLATYSYQTCFWTAVPNGIVDKNHSNDYQCNTFVTSYPVGTGIQEQSLQESVKVFPNPAHSDLTIQLPEGSQEGYLLSMYSVDGQLMKSMENNHSLTVQWDVNNLTGGMYFMEIRGLITGHKAFAKIVVQ